MACDGQIEIYPGPNLWCSNQGGDAGSGGRGSNAMRHFTYSCVMHHFILFLTQVSRKKKSESESSKREQSKKEKYKYHNTSA